MGFFKKRPESDTSFTEQILFSKKFIEWDKQLDELNEQERKETYLCRVKRHIQCCIEPEDE